MPPSQAELNTRLRDLAKRYAEKARELLAAQLVSIALYGSAACEQAGPTSDIDLFVVLQEVSSGMLVRRHLLDPVRESLTPELGGALEAGNLCRFHRGDPHAG